MAIDPDALLAIAVPERRQRYDWRDTALYALGLGYGDDPLDANQLRFLDERRLEAAPTMANVLGHPGFWFRDLATGVDHLRVVHGAHKLTLHRPLPPTGEVIGRTRVVGVVDKGADKGAVVHWRREVVDAASDAPLASILQSTFCRGDGGFGRSLGEDHAPAPEPEGPPTMSVAIATPPQLALIYRLSGDLNPLHSDPATARAAGFTRPILHGLATFGIAGRALMAALCDHEPARVRELEARFSAPLYPGETVAVDIWSERPGEAAFRARVVERDVVVLRHGRFRYAAG